MAPKRQGPGAADVGSAKQRKKPKLEASGPSIPQWNSLELLAASRVSYLAEDDQTLQSVAERSAKACSGYTFILSKVVDEHGPWDTKVVKKKGHGPSSTDLRLVDMAKLAIPHLYLNSPIHSRCLHRAAGCRVRTPRAMRFLTNLTPPPST